MKFLGMGVPELLTSDDGKPEIDLDEDEEAEEEPKKKAVKAAKKVPAASEE